MSESTDTALEDNYEIVSVCPTEPPPSMTGTGWHCYLIVQGKNTIRGYRQGSLKSVTLSVEETVARLNERRMGKRGRVHLEMSSRNKAAGAK